MKPRCGALLPRVVAQWARWTRWSTTPRTFEYDDAASFSYAAMEKHLRGNTGAAILLAQALHVHVAARGAAGEDEACGAVVNLLDQKLWNPNPDFLSYTLSKAALEAATTVLAQALAPRVRVVRRGARPDADQPPAERRRIRSAAHA